MAQKRNPRARKPSDFAAKPLDYGTVSDEGIPTQEKSLHRSRYWVCFFGGLSCALVIVLLADKVISNDLKVDHVLQNQVKLLTRELKEKKNQLKLVERQRERTKILTSQVRKICYSYKRSFLRRKTRALCNSYYPLKNREQNNFNNTPR